MAPEEVFAVKAWGVASAAVLALIPAVALYWQGEFRNASAASAVTPPASVVVAPAPAPTQAPAPVPTQAPAPVPAQASVPTPAPVPTVIVSDWSKAAQLEAAVTRAMADFPGQYSVVVQDLNSGKRWARGGDDRYHPASTIKMPVSLYALEQYRSGKVSWQDTITYTQVDFESPGGGAFETAPFGGQYPVENLVNRALQYSNNVAVNMLGRYFGWENIRTWSRTINGELYRTADGTPQVTALSELGWWLHLNKLSREDPKAAELLLNPLRNVAYDGRIPQGLPNGVSYLHKFGSYNGYYHDGGIVFASQPYALIVLTRGGTEDQADTAIAGVSAAVYQVLGK